MGFFTDIAEIAGLLLAAYTAGWLVGYFAHRLTARAPQLETVAATKASPIDPEAGNDALVKAPVVVPVATTPPPQVLAVATAIEPVKATAVPDAGQPAPDSTPQPVISALDTLKSLSTAMPLMPPAEQPEPQPEPQPPELRQQLETTPVIADTIVAELAPSSPVAESPEPAGESVEPAVSIAATPLPELAAAPEQLEPLTAAEPVVAVAPSTPAARAATEGLEPIPVAAPSAAKAEPITPSVKPRIRVAPATKAGEIAQPAAPLSTEPPPPPATPQPATPPMPASAAGVPWAGAIRGQEAEKFAPVSGPEATRPAAASDADEAIDEPDAALDVALLSSMADELKLSPAASAADDAVQVVAAAQPTAPPAPAEPEVVVAAVARPEAVAAAPEPIAPAPQVVSAPLEQPSSQPSRPALEEDAAMRAIEGGWSRRDVRALGDSPELTDVTAAVSAAQVAVEQVLARNGVDTAEPDARAQAAFGKPAGLVQPRDGRRDSLKRIDGLGPLDEVTLNNLGIYHFDQIAKWTEREVLWLENHAFAVGRIGREGWQDQARELIAERDATRALR